MIAIVQDVSVTESDDLHEGGQNAEDQPEGVALASHGGVEISDHPQVWIPGANNPCLLLRIKLGWNRRIAGKRQGDSRYTQNVICFGGRRAFARVVIMDGRLQGTDFAKVRD